MKKSSLIVAVACSTVIASAIGAFFIWQNQPSKGVISQTATPGTDVKGSVSTVEELSTQLFDTKITSNFRMRNRNEVPTTSIYGQYLLSDKDAYISDQLAITIGAVKSNSINDVSPVQFRRASPEKYTLGEPDSGFPANSIIFLWEDGYEKSVFWVEDGEYIGVVASGSAARQIQLNNSLSVLVSNWRSK